MAQPEQITRESTRRIHEVGTPTKLLRIETGGEGRDSIISVIESSGKSETVVLNFTVPYDKYRSFAGKIQVQPPRGKRKKQEG